MVEGTHRGEDVIAFIGSCSAVLETRSVKLYFCTGYVE